MKSEYQIGDVVSVVAIAKRRTEHGKRSIVRSPLCKSFIAQVVGARRLQIGIYHCSDCSSLNGHDGGEGAYLACTSTVLVYSVRRGMLNKSIDVLPNDLSIVSRIINLPWLYLEKS